MCTFASAFTLVTLALSVKCRRTLKGTLGFRLLISLVKEGVLLSKAHVHFLSDKHAEFDRVLNKCNVNLFFGGGNS